MSAYPVPATPVRVPPAGVRPYPVHKVPGSSTRDVGRVARLDGRTRVIALRLVAGRWYRVGRRTAFTRSNVQRLRQHGVNELILRRGTLSVSIPIAWIGDWQH